MFDSPEKPRLIRLERPLGGESFRSTHDIAWDRLAADDALAVRQALIAAHYLREFFGSEVAQDYLEDFTQRQLAA